LADRDHPLGGTRNDAIDDPGIALGRAEAVALSASATFSAERHAGRDKQKPRRANVGARGALSGDGGEGLLDR
jgi:hypothetical protein